MNVEYEDNSKQTKPRLKVRISLGEIRSGKMFERVDIFSYKWLTLLRVWLSEASTRRERSDFENE